MSSRVRVRAALVLAAVAVALVPAGGETSLIGRFNCVGSGTFTGSYGQVSGINVWYWTLVGRGTCTNINKVFEFRIAFASTFHNGQYPGPVTFSPQDPWANWRIQASLTNGGTERQFPQVWYGIGDQGLFQIHHYDTSVPHPYFAVGGVTGLGVTVNGPNMGTWAKPTIKARFAFTFGSDPLPLPPIPS